MLLQLLRSLISQRTGPSSSCNGGTSNAEAVAGILGRFYVQFGEGGLLLDNKLLPCESPLSYLEQQTERWGLTI